MFIIRPISCCCYYYCYSSLCYRILIVDFESLLPVTSIRVELKWQLMVNRVSKDKLFYNEREDNPKRGRRKRREIVIPTVCFSQSISVAL